MKINEIQQLNYLTKQLIDPPIWTEEEKKIIAWSLCWEGSISLSRSRHPNNTYRCINPSIQIGNTNLELLKEFHKIFKFGVIQENTYRHPSIADKPYHQLHIKALKEVQYVLTQIYPYLPAKQTQAKYTIAFIESRLSANKNTHNPQTPFELECFQLVKKANHRGVH